VHLTLHADYALRVLLYLAAHPERVVSTQEVSEAYGISKHHLVRVMQGLPPSEISVGQVVRRMEPDFNIVECFDAETNGCPIAPACGLVGVLNEAMRAFLTTLDKYTLEDLLRRSPRKLSSFFLKPAPDAEVG
jgi:Rrf2 family nitric oxide-sensitive transcriptional repressor